MRYEKEMKQPVTKWLQERGYEVGYELMISGYADVIGFGFAERIGRPVPKLERVVVIELKLRDIKGVFRQARGNKYSIGSSWVAMPEDFCEHISSAWLDRFREEGIGLLAVGDSVSIIFPPFGGNCNGKPFRNGLHKKLWRVHRMNEKRKTKKRTFVECFRYNIEHNWDDSSLWRMMLKDDCVKACDKIEQFEAEVKSQAEHIELLNECDDSSTEVIGKMDIEIEQLQVGNKRMKNALQAWIEVNEGAPNKYQWAKDALGDI